MAASSKWIKVDAVAQDDPEFNSNWKYSGQKAGYRNALTGEFSESLPGELLKEIGRTWESKNDTAGAMYQDSAGNFYSARESTQGRGNLHQLSLTPQQVQDSIQGAATAAAEDQASRDSSWDSKIVNTMDKALPYLQAAAVIVGTGGFGAFAVPGAGTAAAASAAPAATPGILSNAVVKTALTGAAKSAAVSTGIQFATTGKVDFKKVAISAAAGGFGSVLGETIGGTIGQIAGSIGGAVVGAALTPDSRVTGAVSGAANTVTAPVSNPAELSFKSPGIINAKAPRTTDWKTPRLDWASQGAT